MRVDYIIKLWLVNMFVLIEKCECLFGSAYFLFDFFLNQREKMRLVKSTLALASTVTAYGCDSLLVDGQKFEGVELPEVMIDRFRVFLLITAFACD